MFARIALNIGDTTSGINYITRLLHYWDSDFFEKLSIETTSHIYITNQLIDLLYASGKIKDALLLSLQLLHYGPYSSKTFTQIGNIYMTLNYYHRALYSLKAAAYLNPSPVSFFNLALAYKALGYQDSFLHYFKRYLSFKPHGSNREIPSPLLSPQ